MDFLTGRPDHIEDYICRLKAGQWFGWSDPYNKIYANLVIYDGSSKPTEKECTDGLASLQAEWDLENDSYKSKRRAEYPPLEDFADAMYWNSKGDSTKLEAYYAACEKVKTDNPKPS
tara:strand:+ start:820 stop:1170 length:351 start_codon:yes stop_codon:yes gene_type:complete